MTEVVQEQSFEDAFNSFAEDKASEHITDTLAAEAADDGQHQDTTGEIEQDDTQDVAASAATESESTQQVLTPEQLEHKVKSEKGRTAALNRKHAEAQAEIALLRKQNERLKAQQVPDLPELGDEIELSPNLAAHVTAQHASQKQQHQASIEANKEQLAAAEQRALSIAAAYVEERVAGWSADIQKPEFAAWVNSQPRGIQAMSVSNDPDDVVFLVTQFRNSVNPQAAQQDQQVKEITQERQARLAGSVTPKSSAKPVRSEAGSLDSLDAALNFWAGQK